MAGLAERAAADAEHLLRNARRALRNAQRTAERVKAAGGRRGDAALGRRRGRLHRAIDDLTGLLEVTRRIATQTRQRLSGQIPAGSTRRVSLHDEDARPIAKGRLGKPIEFGYKAQVLDNDDGIVLDHTVERGNPADAPQLVPAAHPRHRLDRATPPGGDRGPRLRRGRVENALHGLGVRTVAIPRKGRPGQARQALEHRPAFRRNVKWRTGSEARISTRKRQYGSDRTRLDHLNGARIWAGHGVLAHNLVKIAALNA